MLGLQDIMDLFTPSDLHLVGSRMHQAPKMVPLGSGKRITQPITAAQANKTANDCFHRYSEEDWTMPHVLASHCVNNLSGFSRSCGFGNHLSEREDYRMASNSDVNVEA